MSTSTTSTTIQLVANILESVLSDVPLLIEVIETIIPIFKENRVPTQEEWTTLQTLLDEKHTALQTAIQEELTKLESSAS